MAFLEDPFKMADLAHMARIKVRRRDGSRFGGARVRLSAVMRGAFGATGDIYRGTVPASGEVEIPLPAQGARVHLLVNPPLAKMGYGFGPAWEKNDTAFWTIDIELDWDPSLPRLLRMSAEWMVVSQATEARASGTLFELEVRMTRVRPVDDAIVEKVLAPDSAASGFNPGPSALTLFSRDGSTSEDYPFTHPVRTAPNLVYEYAQNPLFANGTRVVDKGPVKDPLPDYNRAATLYEVAPRRDAKDNEEKGFGPKLCGAYFPPDTRVQDFPCPLMIYFAPYSGQDQPQGKIERSTQYADAGYYFDWRFYRSFDYLVDPWTPNQVFAIGLRHQVLAAGRKLGIVAPVPEVGVPGELGHATEPDFMAELVEEIVAYELVIQYQTWKPLQVIPPLPGLGRVALGAFSIGNSVMATFAAALRSWSSRSTPARGRSTRRNPPASTQSFVVNSCLGFLRAFPRNQVAFRFYSQWAYMSLANDVRQAVDSHWSPGQPYDATSERASVAAPEPKHNLGEVGHVTNAHLPAVAWPNPPTNWAQIHAMIPGTVFTHALRLSQFPVR